MLTLSIILQLDHQLKISLCSRYAVVNTEDEFAGRCFYPDFQTLHVSLAYFALLLGGFFILNPNATLLPPQLQSCIYNSVLTQDLPPHCSTYPLVPGFVVTVRPRRCNATRWPSLYC